MSELTQAKDFRTELINESLKELEFDHILDSISSYAHSETARDIILDIKPLKSKESIQNRLDQVNELKRLNDSDREIQFNGFNDLTTVLTKSKIPGSVLNTSEILDVYDLISSSRRIASFIDNLEIELPLLQNKASTLHKNKQLERHIDSIIDNNGEIKDNASPELKKIRKDIFSKSQRLRDRAQKIMMKSVDDDIAQEDFVSVREDRFVIPIKASNKRTFGGIIHGTSATGQTVFLEPQEIIEMNNELSMLKNDEKKEIYRLLEMLTRFISQDANNFIESIKVLIELDTLSAIAKYAVKTGGVKPTINESDTITLSGTKHPILVQRLGFKHVVPLDIELKEDSLGYVISGPNAGGKTVSLKTVGLSVAMALSGIFPVGEVNTCIRDIFTSIGDHQSIENDLSTFSSQISQMRDIIDHAGRESLVLIDEICSGTDPQEGSALASGVMDTFVEYGIYFIVTTHQSSLKNYALNKGIIKNASLEFDDVKLKPSYKFLAGIPGNSYAFNLAENLGMNTSVLKRAEKYTFSGQLELEKSIKELNNVKKETERLKDEAKHAKNKAKSLEKDYRDRLEKLKLKQKDHLDKAKREASFIVENANKLIENKIREIEEQKKKPGEIKKEFLKEKEEIVKVAKETIEESKPERSTEPVEVGDHVLLDDGDSVGLILEIEGKQALVEFNGIKFKTKIKRLHKTKRETTKEDSKEGFTAFVKLGAASSIDLRGKRVEEALAELDKAISDGISGNVPELTVLHGKGTGALRHSIREFLQTHHMISSYREGTIEEGGAGITIVSL